MTSHSRKCYDTTLIYLFILGKQDLLPVDLLNSIPYSTKATWKKYPKEKFIGYAQCHILDEGIRKTELYHKYKHIKKVLNAVELIYTNVSSMLDFVKIPIYQVKENKDRVIDLIAEHKDIIGLQNLLKIFKISRNTYQSWLLHIKVKCFTSYFEQCVRKYGTQLLKPQVEMIKEALTSDVYKHWPVSSIAYYYQRKEWLQASVNSWYKYARLLGIGRRKKRRSKKYDKIPCTRPNEYWHIDITYFTTEDKAKHCIYFLSDNFSRKIIAWRLTSEVSWKYVKECIDDAYKVAINMEHALNLKIVSDGGPENIHHCLNDYVSGLVGNIQKVIALKDITFSNSPAETKNRTFKSYYTDDLIENKKQLYERINFYVQDVNDNRPSGVLKGFTNRSLYKY
jgi:putative transposase